MRKSTLRLTLPLIGLQFGMKTVTSMHLVIIKYVVCICTFPNTCLYQYLHEKSADSILPIFLFMIIWTIHMYVCMQLNAYQLFPYSKC